MSLCEAVGSSECAREGGRTLVEDAGSWLPTTGIAVDIAYLITAGVALVLVGLLVWLIVNEVRGDAHRR